MLSSGAIWTPIWAICHLVLKKAKQKNQEENEVEMNGPLKEGVMKWIRHSATELQETGRVTYFCFLLK